MNPLGSELSVRGATPALTFAPDQVELIKQTVAVGTTDNELKLFLYQCKRTGLDPLARQIYCTMRQYRDNRGNWQQKMSIQVSIDGLRLIAERTGKYAGQLGPFWVGENGEWKDAWIENSHPLAAMVGILRTDFKEPLWSVARFDGYAQTKDGKPVAMWAKMPDLMLAKCAEALGLRRAFPQELCGLYTADEMAQAEEEDRPAPVAEPDVMTRPTRTGPVAPVAVTNEPSAAATSANAGGMQSTPSIASTAYPEPIADDAGNPIPPKVPPANKTLTMQEVLHLERMARAAADRGEEVFGTFWRGLRTVNTRKVVEGLATELRDRMNTFRTANPQTGELNDKPPANPQA